MHWDKYLLQSFAWAGGGEDDALHSSSWLLGILMEFLGRTRGYVVAFIQCCLCFLFAKGQSGFLSSSWGLQGFGEFGKSIHARGCSPVAAAAAVVGVVSVCACTSRSEPS
jgi:hypothetical protein